MKRKMYVALLTLWEGNILSGGNARDQLIEQLQEHLLVKGSAKAPQTR